MSMIESKSSYLGRIVVDTAVFSSGFLKKLGDGRQGWQNSGLVLELGA